MLRKKSCSAATFIILFGCGCVNLKEVNSFSSQSLAGLGKFTDIHYSFQQHCTDRCRFEALRHFEIKRDTACDCLLYQKADRATQQVFNAVRGYFEGLYALSGNTTVQYSFDALQTALADGELGGMRITETDVKAYGIISKILLRACADGYRRKKLAQYIGEANEPIQLLLTKLQFILQQDLAGELDFKKEKLYNHFREMVMNNTLSDYEKGRATLDYYQELSGAGLQQRQIMIFSKGLSGIAAGHQELYNNRDKITATEVREMLIRYGSDLRVVISEFDKLQK